MDDYHSHTTLYYNRLLQQCTTAILMIPIMQSRSDRLRVAMAKAGMDQTGLAAAVGLSQQAISLIINGRREGSKHFGRLAKALGVPLPWLISGANAPAWASADSEELDYEAIANQVINDIFDDLAAETNLDLPDRLWEWSADQWDNAASKAKIDISARIRAVANINRGEELSALQIGLNRMRQSNESLPDEALDLALEALSKKRESLPRSHGRSKIENVIELLLRRQMDSGAITERHALSALQGLTGRRKWSASMTWSPRRTNY